MKAAALRIAPPTIIAIEAIVFVYIQWLLIISVILEVVWKNFLVLKVFLQCDAPSHNSCELNVVHDICTGVGCEVFFDDFFCQSIQYLRQGQ